MKIIDDKPVRLTPLAQTIPVGTVFRGKVGNERAATHTTEVFLRGTGCMISLTDPNRAWLGSTLGMYIYDYEELDATLHVSEKSC